MGPRGPLEAVLPLCIYFIFRGARALRPGRQAPTYREIKNARPSARDTPVAACMTKTERQPPVTKAGPSGSMHLTPTLAMGPSRKAILALVVRSRTLTYALWACPVDAVGCTAAALAAKTER